MMDRPTVLLADDHASVLERLVALLKDRFDVVQTVTDGTQLVEAALRLHPAIIITDISMPAVSGIDAIHQLRRAGSDARIVVLTMHADPELVDEAMRAGASAYVLKVSAGAELVPAIEEVLAGRLFVTSSLRRPESGTSKPSDSGRAGRID